MPRKSQQDMIADLERKLEEAKAKAGERKKVEATTLRTKIEALKVREAKIAGQILEAEEQLAALVTEAPAQLTFSAVPTDEVAVEEIAKPAKAKAV